MQTQTIAITPSSSRKKRIFSVLVIALLALGTLAGSQSYQNMKSQNVPAAHAAAVDYFLKLDGIDGESTDDRHKNEIDVESWSWGLDLPESNAFGGGGGAGKVQMQDFHFTKKVDKASPKLMLSAATGKHIKEAKLVARKAGGDQQEYLVITFSDILVSSYQIGGDANSIPTDQISLNFAKVEMEHKQQNPDGSLGSPVSGGFDVKKNQKL